MLTPYREQDLAACARIFTDVYTNSPWNYAAVTNEKARRYVRDLTRAPGFAGFVYHADNNVAGMVLGTVNDYFFAPQYDIKELAVAPACQRQGIGTRMLDELAAALAQRGVAYIMLQTSREIPAYAFYLKNGYVTVEANVFLAKPL